MYGSIYLFLFFQTLSINVSLFGGGHPNCDVIFRGVILFVTECDTGGGGGPKMVIFA